MVNIRPFQSRPLAVRIGSSTRLSFRPRSQDPSQLRPRGPILSHPGHTECPSPPSRDAGPPIRRGSLDGPPSCRADVKRVGLCHLLTALPGPLLPPQLLPSQPLPARWWQHKAAQVVRKAWGGAGGPSDLHQRTSCENLLSGPPTLPSQLSPSLPASSSPAVLGQDWLVLLIEQGTL